jgi:hypothetical protein
MKWFKRFQMSETTFNQIDSLPDEMQLKFYKAVCNYGLFGVEPDFAGVENSVWIPMKDLIDSARARSKTNSDNGKMGGAPVGNNNRKQATSTEIKRNQPTLEDVTREAEEYGYYLDEGTVNSFFNCGLNTLWLAAPHSFLEFVAEKIDEKYDDKPFGERKAIFIAAVKTWDDLRNEYPEWLSRKQRSSRAAQIKEARNNRPEVCRCGGKLVKHDDNEMYCLSCSEKTFVFDEESLKWEYREPSFA